MVAQDELDPTDAEIIDGVRSGVPMGGKPDPINEIEVDAMTAASMVEIPVESEPDES